MMYNKMQYTFNKNFKYFNKDKVDKTLQYIYYHSYISNIVDLNTNMYKKLIRHKQMIDKAIDYAYNQLKRGFDMCHIIPYSYLNKKYVYQVNKFAEYLHKLDRLEVDKKRKYCSQKYWIYAKHIKSYFFRDNDLSSKFQAFVEFESADRRDNTIKLNLQMTKKAFEHREEIFLDGFDIVFDKDLKNNCVRHVSQEIITRKQDNSIERHITIDAFVNIYSALIDKNPENSDEKHRIRFNEQKKLVCCDFKKSKGSKLVQKHLDKLRKFEKPDLFGKRMSEIRQNMKNRLSNIIGYDNESKVIIMAPTNTTSIVYDRFIKMFTRLAADFCEQYGISYKINRIPCQTIISQVKEYKKKTNEYSKAHNYGFKFDDINKVKASDIINCSILCEYPDFYIIFKKRGKFTKNGLKYTGKKGCSVLDKIKIIRARMKEIEPSYESYSSFKDGFILFNPQSSEEAIRKAWIDSIKESAKNYYHQASFTPEELQKEAIDYQKQLENEQLNYEKNTFYKMEKVSFDYKLYVKQCCKSLQITENDPLFSRLRKMFINDVKEVVKENFERFINNNKRYFELNNIDYISKYHLKVDEDQELEEDSDDFNFV